MFLCSCDSSKNIASSEQIEQIEKVEQTDKVSATTTTKQTEQTKTVSKTSTPTSTQKFSYSTVIISSPTETKKEFPEADAYTLDEETKPYETILCDFARIERSGYYIHERVPLDLEFMLADMEKADVIDEREGSASLRYALYDLNNDGSKELICGKYNWGMSVIYTLKDGKPVAVYYEGGRPYLSLVFAEDGSIILSHNSARMDYSDELFYRMDANGDFILLDRLYTEGLVRDKNREPIGFQHHRARVINGEKVPITEKEYCDLLRKYGCGGYFPKEENDGKHIPLKWKPIVGLINKSQNE